MQNRRPEFALLLPVEGEISKLMKANLHAGDTSKDTDTNIVLSK